MVGDEMTPDERAYFTKQGRSRAAAEHIMAARREADAETIRGLREWLVQQIEHHENVVVSKYREGAILRRTLEKLDGLARHERPEADR